MSISFSGNKIVQTGTSTGILSNQANCSISFKFKYLGGLTGVSARLVRFSGSGVLDTWLLDNDATTIKIRANPATINGASNLEAPIIPGVSYHVAITWEPDLQCLYVNGLLSATGLKAGLTAVQTAVLTIGTTSAGAPQAVIGDVAAWNGYKLTPADVAALRDGAAPSTIGGAATLRVGWTLAGPSGNTVVFSPPDVGIANSYGVAALDLKSAPNGAVTYIDPISVVAGAAVQHARVTTSGEMVSFTFAAISDGSYQAGSVITPPTLSVNGVSRGALVQVPMANITCLLFKVPGAPIAASDAVTFSAANGWANTPPGFVGASTNAPVANCVGKSAFGTDDLAKTFIPGVNFDWSQNPYNPAIVLKDVFSRCNGLSNATFDKSGNGVMTASTGEGSIVQDAVISGLAKDEYLPIYPNGAWAVRWDDADPVANPCSFDIYATGGVHFTVTEDTAARNNGTAGVGQARVFNVSRNASGGARSLILRITCANRNPKIRNLRVFSPGTFPYTPGSTATIPPGDRLAINPQILERFPDGLGCVRAISATTANAGSGYGDYEPEDFTSVDDFMYSAITIGDIPLAQSRPWNPAATGYAYSSNFGSPYTATLGAPITNTGTVDAQGRLTSVITITDAATAPVLVGLRLKVDSEEMGVLAVSGTSVTVRRGSRKTTPATHAAGAIQVQNRLAITIASFPQRSKIVEFVSASPHGMMSGVYYNFTGPFGTITTTDGQSVGVLPSCVFVTGASTFLYYQYGNVVPAQTVTTTNSYDATTKCQRRVPAAGIPYESITSLATALNANAHISIAMGLNDDANILLARRIRDTMPPGRKVYIEWGNEPWNFGPPWGTQTVFSEVVSHMHYGTSVPGSAYVADRNEQIRLIWVDIFNEGGRGRGGEVVNVYNRQCVDYNGNVESLMDYAGGKGYGVGGMAVAPYIDLGRDAPLYGLFRGASDAASADLIIHKLWYGNSGSDSIRMVLQNARASVEAFNLKYGRTGSAAAVLHGYEGGDQVQFPNPGPVAAPGNVGGWCFALGAAVAPGDSTITIAPSGTTSQLPFFGVGDKLFITSTPHANMATTDEWVVITGTAASGNDAVLTVTRGQFGTSPQTHALPKWVRPDWVERTRDVLYHPSWRVVTKDILAIFQSTFRDHLTYSHAHPWPSGNKQWGIYTNSIQPYGKGDGSDGKANNRLCLATKGLPNTKADGVYQDVQNVSTRGAAYVEWMAEVRETPTEPTIKPIPAVRDRRLTSRPG